MNVTRVECHRQKAECNSEVRSKLKCEHDVVWTCGDEEGRLRVLKGACVSCLHVQWKKALDAVLEANSGDIKEALKPLIVALREKAMRLLEDAEVIERVDVKVAAVEEEKLPNALCGVDENACRSLRDRCPE